MKTFLAAVIMFGILIFVHELGHYILARLSGVKVLEFALGFGPKLISRERKGTVYSLRAFPLGGFCRMLGEDPDEAGEEGSFQLAPVYKRFAIISAGPLMNVLLTVVLFAMISFFLLGVPQTDSTVIGTLAPGYPAAAAGLEAGDEIIAIDGVPVNNWSEVQEQIRKRPEDDITVRVRRGSTEREITVLSRVNTATEEGMIGISPTSRRYQTISSLGYGIRQTWELTRLLVVSLVQMITGQMSADVAGPIGVVQVISEVVETGISNLLFLGGLISINLAIINILPIPALDGSRLVFLLVEAIRGKPIDPEKEGLIHMIGFAFLITLMLVVTYHDLLRLDFF